MDEKVLQRVGRNKAIFIRLTPTKCGQLRYTKKARSRKELGIRHVLHSSFLALLKASSHITPKNPIRWALDRGTDLSHDQELQFTGGSFGVV